MVDDTYGGRTPQCNPPCPHGIPNPRHFASNHSLPDGRAFLGINPRNATQLQVNECFGLFAITENGFPVYPLACRDFVRSINDLELTNGRSTRGQCVRSAKVLAMQFVIDRLELQRSCFVPLLILMLCTAAHPLDAQAPSAPAASAPAVPDWAQPGSPTHVQVPPPADFHRPSRNCDAPIGVFQGQSDIGAAVVPGSADYDANTKQYTIHSAGYNIWYSRDEFRYLWRKMSSGSMTTPGRVTASSGPAVLRPERFPTKLASTDQ